MNTIRDIVFSRISARIAVFVIGAIALAWLLFGPGLPEILPPIMTAINHAVPTLHFDTPLPPPSQTPQP